MMHYVATIGNAAPVRTETREASPGFSFRPPSPPFPLPSFPFSRNYQNRGMRVNLAYCEFELKINSWLAHADLSGRMANSSKYRGGERLFKYYNLFIDSIEALSFEHHRLRINRTRRYRALISLRSQLAE